MKDERTASEVLSEVEAKLTKVVGLSQNTDNNIKIILGRFNALVKEVAQLKEQMANGHAAPVAPKKIAQPVQPKRSVPDTQGIVGAPSVSAYEEGNEPTGQIIPPQVLAQAQVKQESDILVAVPINKSLAADDELTEEVEHKGVRRDLRKPADYGASPKRNISQKVLFPDGRSVAFAQIEVFNQSGFLVKQGRTSPSGIWQAQLDPGDYRVHLLKRMSADGSKLPVELDMKIRVPSTTGPHELPSPELPEIYAQGE